MGIPFTTDDLVRRFRSDVDDPLRGPVNAPDNDALWSIADVQDYMVSAAWQVGRRTESLFSTFTLPVAAGNALVNLPTGMSTTLDVRRAYMQTLKRDLHETNIETPAPTQYDYGQIYGSFGWETLTGPPQEFIRNYMPGVLRLVPIPVQNDTLAITASFMPAFMPGMPLPYSDMEDVELMLLWMKKLAYSKHDADTFDEKRAATFEAEFYRRAAERNAEALRIRRAPQPIRFSW
jgi:hypothetical protein